MTSPAQAAATLRSPAYLRLLIFAAVLIGVPVSAVAYGFLLLVNRLQHWTFSSLPRGLGFHAEPTWWPLPVLVLAGLLVAIAIKFLPGRGGHSPAEGFGMHPAPLPRQLPGVILAALAGLSLGVVLGPEAPLIAMGGGLGLLTAKLVKRDMPQQALVVISAAGSFAAISALFGNPLASAFLLMEAVGVGGAALELVLLPGILAAGIGALIFLGLGHWSGFGELSLSIPHLPHVGPPTAGEFGWAIVIGLAAAVLGGAIRRLGQLVRPLVEPRVLAAGPIAGLAVGGLAVLFVAVTGRSSSDVLFSGQNELPKLISGAAAWTVGPLLLLLACKGLAYGISLGSFRGGPIFPSLYLGAVGGIALSHLPGLSTIPAMAMGMAALAAVMLGLPLSSTLIVSLLLSADGLAVIPLVIVAAVTAYVAAARLGGGKSGQQEADAQHPAKAQADQAKPGTASAGPSQ
jgi:H+/Cl- antiporter ClcA